MRSTSSKKIVAGHGEGEMPLKRELMSHQWNSLHEDHSGLKQDHLLNMSRGEMPQ